MKPETAELFARYVVPNYTRFPISLVRGEGSYVWDDQGRRYLDFFPGVGLQFAGALSAASGRSDSAAGRRIDSCAEYVAHGSAGAMGPAAFGTELRRQSVLLQFGRGSERGGDQVGAAARDGRALQNHYVSGRLSRPHVWRDERHGAAEVSRRNWAAVAGFSYAPYGDLEAVRKLVDRETCAIHDRAGTRRRRHSDSARRFLAGLAATRRRARPAADFRRSAKRLRSNGQMVRLPTFGRDARRHDARQKSVRRRGGRPQL